MKTETHYICEYCNNEYRNEQDALNCEASHKCSVEITQEIFEKKSALFEDNYPTRIMVLMSDGKKILYKQA